MNFTKSLLAASALLVGLFASASLALATSEVSKAPTANASPDQLLVISEVRYLTTRSSKKYKKKKKHKKKKAKKAKKIKTIAQIRDGAIKDTLSGLKELRPYARNYKGLKSAVRRYWRRNVRRPSGNALARTIMRYVKRKNRKLVRSDVFSGSKSGARKVQKQLQKRVKNLRRR